MKQRRSENVFVKLLGSKGFYILLALALAIISVSAYVNTTRQRIAELNKPVESYEFPVFSEDEGFETPEPTAAPTPQPTLEVQQAITTNADGEAVMEPQALIPPLQGEMTVGFSGDTLVYNKTMEDWRVHSGIDIAADINEKVVAAADGTVTKAESDELNGYTVVISHPFGLETVYCNLKNTGAVQVGQEVLQGDEIGVVGDSGILEIEQPPHLHFAVMSDGKFVDPFDFME